MGNPGLGVTISPFECQRRENLFLCTSVNVFEPSMGFRLKKPPSLSGSSLPLGCRNGPSSPCPEGSISSWTSPSIIYDIIVGFRQYEVTSNLLDCRFGNTPWSKTNCLSTCKGDHFMRSNEIVRPISVDVQKNSNSISNFSTYAVMAIIVV